MVDTRKALFAGCMSVLLAFGFSVVTAQDASEDGWKSLFNGKDLDGWRIGNDGDFKVEDGAIVVRGARAYLFTEEQYDHFDFKCEVMTEPGSNSGIFFHTPFVEGGTPPAYEVQVNCSHRDPVKNGSLWGVVKSFDPIAKDGEWYTLQITVRGQNIVTRVNDRVVVDYTEPPGVTGSRRLGKGHLAIQAHDPKSVIRFRGLNIKTLKLPPPRPRRRRRPQRTLTMESVYKTIGERELKMHLHLPPGWQASDQRPAIVFFFGGGWRNGRVEQFEPQAEYLASRGMVAARADYRVKSRDEVTPDQCVEDARSAVRWLRANHARLGIDPDQLVTSGGSAGGHLAACAMIANSVEGDGDELWISTVPRAMVLFNPVLSFETERMLERLGDKSELAGKISPTRHLHRDTPPALILFGTDDRLKVHGDLYWKKAEGLGARAEKYIAEGQGHGFFNRSPWRERTLIATDRFLASLGLLEGEPTIKEPASDR